MTIEEYVSKDEYLDRYEKRTEYKGYTVYEAWRSEDEGACIGYPCYLFVAGDTVRGATLEEIEQVMDLLCTDEDFHAVMRAVVEKRTDTNGIIM